VELEFWEKRPTGLRVKWERPFPVVLAVKEGYLADGKIFQGDRIERLNGMEVELLVKGLTQGKLEEMLSERPLRLTLLRDRKVDPARYPCGEFLLRNTAGVCRYPEPEEPGFRTAERRVSWNHRRPLLVEEMSALDPDIICLQDVDHINDINDALSPLGYESWFVRDPSAIAKTEGQHVFRAGPAVFWKKDRAELQMWESVPLSMEEGTALVTRLNVGDVPLIVVSTRLKPGCNATQEGRRWSQVTDLVVRLSREDETIAVIFAGNLESHYEEIDGGESDVPFDPKVVPAMRFAGFRSAYEPFPSYTTWAGRTNRDFKATVDYIFMKGPIAVRRFWDVPAESHVADYPERLPNDNTPSDHLPLCADLELLPRNLDMGQYGRSRASASQGGGRPVSRPFTPH
jgi:endonuclease/exonuclease/phosphatase family metal-dependent hydrolase